MRTLVPTLASLLLAVGLLGLLGLTGCAPKSHAGLLIYTAESHEGGDLSAKDLEYLATDLDTRIAELGLSRKDVFGIPPRTVRIVLPESAVSRIPEIRKMLEEATDIRAKLTFVKQGG